MVVDLSNPITSVIPSLDGRVLVVLARTTRPMPGRQIARLIPDASLRGVQLALNRLEQHGLVRTDPYGHAVLYTANDRHILWPAIEALVEAVDKVPARLREFIREVVASSVGEDEAAEVSVALFGSVARGTSTPDSDIDLLVVTPQGRDDEHVDALGSHLIEDVMVFTGNTCNVYHATRARLRELVREQDPMVESWLHDAEMVNGPDLRPILEGASWPA